MTRGGGKRSSTARRRMKKKAMKEINKNKQCQDGGGKTGDGDHKKNWVDAFGFEPLTYVSDEGDAADDRDSSDQDGESKYGGDDYGHERTAVGDGLKDNDNGRIIYQMKAAQQSSSSRSSSSIVFSIISWNVLAESYCSKRSHSNLPPKYQQEVFQPKKRRNHITNVLRRKFLPQMGVGSAAAVEFGGVDIVCLQEVDLDCIGTTLREHGYVGVETPRMKGGGRTGGKVDSCAVYVRNHHMTVTPGTDSSGDNPNQSTSSEANYWDIVDHEVIRLDDLAFLSTENQQEEEQEQEQEQEQESQEKQKVANKETDTTAEGASTKGGLTASNITSNLQGLQQSFLRRNFALLVRIRHRKTKQTLVIANAHLFWHPGYEYVKLCQTHYILLRAKIFIQRHKKEQRQEKDRGESMPSEWGGDNGIRNKSNNQFSDQKESNDDDEPFILCGDLNSRPNGAVHSYLTNGTINAKIVAPWYNNYKWDESTEDDSDEGGDSYQGQYGGMLGKHVSLEDTNLENNTGDNTRTLYAKTDGTTDQINAIVSELSGLSMLDDGGGSIQSSYSAANQPHLPPPGHPYAPAKDQNINNSKQQRDQSQSSPTMRYLLDFTLNKYCRWLRILGQDALLETEEEEKMRTKEGKMVLFERCVKEGRTLVTTSTRLLHRTDCPPGTYCINPTMLPHLEVALAHMLLTHGIILKPSTFLTRCVVCNGSIIEVDDANEKLRILKDYQAPSEILESGLEVYECDGCRQGYWWCDRPTSSASRVKNAATRLLELCLRAGVPCEDDMCMFAHINAEEQKQIGWDFSQKGSELLKQKLDVIDWLRNEKLSSPFKLESVYAFKTKNDNVVGECIPFTNVTDGFIDTLDYIFITPKLDISEKLHVPSSFKELNTLNIRNGHLLPSDIWPSDHIAIGARLSSPVMTTEEESTAAKRNDNFLETSQDDLMCLSVNAGPSLLNLQSTAQLNHGMRCTCGCIPKLPSLFEMAELRKQAKLKGK